MPPMIRHLGDRGLLVELGHGIDPAVNRRVKQLHRIIARERPHGVVETVPAYASLLVVFDPLQASPEALKRLIAGLCDFEDAGPTEDRTVVEIPVVYGGEAGPDLDAVAAHHGLSREAVIGLHTGTVYRVYMIGFTPGFPLHGRTAGSPRYAAAGHPPHPHSQGFGGHRPAPDRDLSGGQPGRMADHWPHAGGAFRPPQGNPFFSHHGRRRALYPHHRRGGRPVAAVDLLEIITPGILASIQDAGRQGFGEIGVAPSGAADSYACRIGNLLVGNLENAAAIEITLMGFQARFLTETVFAVTGADLQPSLNGRALPMWTALKAAPGDILDLPSPVCGCRAYLAVGGGFHIPAVMGSRSTNIGAGFGGFDGPHAACRRSVAGLPAGALSGLCRPIGTGYPQSASGLRVGAAGDSRPPGRPVPRSKPPAVL